MHVQRQSTGELLDLTGAAVLGQGGEARLFLVRDRDGRELAAKLYHQPTPERAHKLTAMLKNPPADPTAVQGHVSIAWPTDLLLSANGSRQVVGFTMPRVTDQDTIFNYYNPQSRRMKHPLCNYLYLLRMARNVAAAVNALHARGYVIGDVNESNILVAETAMATLVDTDSFQVRADTATVYRCAVGKPEFTPPELRNGVFSEVDRCPEHDRFGLAVLFFELLMEGTHPFDGMFLGAGESPAIQDRIASGQFTYAAQAQNTILPKPLAPPFAHLHPRLQQLFLRCFVDGHARPSARPDAEEWMQALEDAERNLRVCTVNDQHRYGNHRSDCPWCERRDRLQGLDSFPSQDAVRRGLHLRPPATVHAKSASTSSVHLGQQPLPRPTANVSLRPPFPAAPKKKGKTLAWTAAAIVLMVLMVTLGYGWHRPSEPITPPPPPPPPPPALLSVSRGFSNPDDLVRHSYGTPSQSFLTRAFNAPTTLGGLSFDTSATVLTKTLSFYPGYTFAYVVAQAGAKPALFLLNEADPTSAVHLDGPNKALYAFGDTLPIQINATNVRDYVVFFFSVVRGKHGRFLLAESTADIAWNATASGEEIQRAAALLKPIVVHPPDGNGRYRLEAFMIFRDSLFKSDVFVDPKSTVSLANEVLLLENLNVRQEAVPVPVPGPAARVPPVPPVVVPGQGESEPMIAEATDSDCVSSCEREEAQCRSVSRRRRESCMRQVIGITAGGRWQECNEATAVDNLACRSELRGCRAACVR